MLILVFVFLVAVIKINLGSCSFRTPKPERYILQFYEEQQLVIDVEEEPPDESFWMNRSV